MKRKKYEKRDKVNKNCEFCLSSYETNLKTRRFCSKKCYYNQLKINLKGKGVSPLTPKHGKNNPNFGKKWSEEKKIEQSNLIKSKINEEYRFKCGSPRRGKKLDAETILKMHQNRTPESYSHPHTKESKSKIGKKSKLKFKNPEYLKKVREKMESNGYWAPISKKSDKEIYFKESNWKKCIIPILHQYKHLIEEKGIFNATKNTKGLVRDHKFSRNSGFNLKVFPEIVRHIENCQIIQHADNVQKRFKKNTNIGYFDDTISLEQLFNLIENTSYEWEEQDKCIELIKDYRNGKRWERRKEA